jgi:hypothetical protein
MRRPFNALFGSWVVVLLLFPASRVEACSRSFPRYVVKSDFVVSVTNDGKPLSGIEVEITKELRTPNFHHETAVLSRTNDQGEVAVHQLPNGNYFIVTRHADIEGEDAAELEVKDSPESRPGLVLRWPGRGVYKLKQVGGTLAAELDSNHPFERSRPLTGAVVLLVDALSNQQIGATSTDQHGDFSFAPTVPPGLYILHISEQGLESKDEDILIQGNIFLVVDSGSEQRAIPKMNLMMTTCGLSGWTGKDQMVIF